MAHTDGPSGFLAGARHALAMIGQLELDADLRGACVVEPEHPDRPQRNLVLDYLRRCDDQAAIAGFCSVLSGYMGIVAEGAIPASEYLRRHVEFRAAARAAQRDERFRQFLRAAVASLRTE